MLLIRSISLHTIAFHHGGLHAGAEQGHVLHEVLEVYPPARIYQSRFLPWVTK